MGWEVAGEWNTECKFRVAVAQSFLVGGVCRGLGVVVVEFGVVYYALDGELIDPLLWRAILRLLTVYLVCCRASLLELCADLMFLQQAFRRLNANTVPMMVGVPKSAEEDKAKGNQ